MQAGAFCPAPAAGWPKNRISGTVASASVSAAHRTDRDCGFTKLPISETPSFDKMISSFHSGPRLPLSSTANPPANLVTSYQVKKTEDLKDRPKSINQFRTLSSEAPSKMLGSFMV